MAAPRARRSLSFCRRRAAPQVEDGKSDVSTPRRLLDHLDAFGDMTRAGAGWGEAFVSMLKGRRMTDAQAALYVESSWRRFEARRRFNRALRSVRAIQAAFHGWLQREINREVAIAAASEDAVSGAAVSAAAVSEALEEALEEAYEEAYEEEAGCAEDEEDHEAGGSQRVVDSQRVVSSGEVDWTLAADEDVVGGANGERDQRDESARDESARDEAQSPRDDSSWSLPNPSRNPFRDSRSSSASLDVSFMETSDPQKQTSDPQNQTSDPQKQTPDRPRYESFESAEEETRADELNRSVNSSDAPIESAASTPLRPADRAIRAAQLELADAVLVAAVRLQNAWRGFSARQLLLTLKWQRKERLKRARGFSKGKTGQGKGEPKKLTEGISSERTNDGSQRDVIKLDEPLQERADSHTSSTTSSTTVSAEPDAGAPHHASSSSGRTDGGTQAVVAPTESGGQAASAETNVTSEEQGGSHAGGAHAGGPHAGGPHAGGSDIAPPPVDAAPIAGGSHAGGSHAGGSDDAPPPVDATAASKRVRRIRRVTLGFERPARAIRRAMSFGSSSHPQRAPPASEPGSASTSQPGSRFERPARAIRRAMSFGSRSRSSASQWASRRVSKPSESEGAASHAQASFEV